MRVLITGGAGFIGSHLADALLGGGHQVTVIDDLSTGSFDNIAHLKGRAGFEYTIDTVMNEPVLAELVDQCDVVYHLAAAVGVRLIVESPGADPRDQRARHGGGAEGRRQEAADRGGGVDLRGVRQERRGAVPRGRRHRARPDGQAPVGVRVQQGARRVPGAGLLEGEAAPGHHRALLQHRRPAADGALRDGRAELRAAGAGRASPSPCSATARRPGASPTWATSSARSPRSSLAKRRTATSTTSATRRRSRSAAWPSG